MEHKLVPQHMNHRNLEERAIKTFKEIFVDILSGLLASFHWSLWDKLLPKAETNINILQQSNVAPKILAYAHLNWPYDYNSHPLAPFGCVLLFHENPDQK